jgi:hypothetical protein
MKRHSPTTNLRMRYCKMVVKSESWSELSSDRDRESLSSILLDVEVPIQVRISNSQYKCKNTYGMQAKYTCYKNRTTFIKMQISRPTTHDFAFPNNNKQLCIFAIWIRLQTPSWSMHSLRGQTCNTIYNLSAGPLCALCVVLHGDLHQLPTPDHSDRRSGNADQWLLVVDWCVQEGSIALCIR